MPFFGLGSDGLEYIPGGTETSDLRLTEEPFRPLKQRVIHDALRNEQPSAESATLGCLVESTRCIPRLDNRCRI